ncbi:winged helix-turn-helix transcriptional regulator [Tenacibaculum agarivorans]|uniref:winged helix-turn-helix transcriptional regulator n=1 Tax=Tenacibaculum agarivorans TaxID=1908389 RepID=UPI00094B8677|nr:helix-turn-helix domain-containing protein [Tenacibaculum agarivorans]
MKVKKEASNFRSNCPLSLGLDLFGDKWSLLIVRDLLYYKERTFKDFSLAKEKISSARLANRLSKLEDLGILTKSNHPTNKKVFIYRLTQKGVDLAPIIAECMSWSYTYFNEYLSDEIKTIIKAYKENPKQVLQQFKSNK